MELQKRNKYTYYQSIRDLQKHEKYRDKIKPHKWYLLYIKNPKNPRYLRKFFETKSQCYRFIKLYLDNRDDLYLLTKGSDLLLYSVKSKSDSNAMVTKYEYPDWCKTKQQQKNYRKYQRFKLRKKRLRKSELGLKHSYPKGKISKRKKQKIRRRNRQIRLKKIKI
jgi:hypothetical protein